MRPPSRHASLATAIALALAIPAVAGLEAPALADAEAGVAAEAAPALPPLAAAIAGLVPQSPPLPEDPVGALEAEVAGFLADLGFDPRHASAVRGTDLDPALLGRTAQALAALHACHDATQAALAVVPPAEVVRAVRNDPSSLDAAPFEGIRACALPAAQAIVELEAAALALPAEAEPQSGSTTLAPPAQNDINIWPVLVVDDGGNDAYRHDYVLIVETAGNDVYDNNAGSNMIDTRFAPDSSPFPGIDPVPHVAGVNDGDDDRSGFGRSEGCAIALGSLLSGNCTPVAAAVVDTSGTDRYGVLHSPAGTVDARCTADPLVLRMVTNGVGFLGYGELLDTAGSDFYNGRTGSNGAGHIFGVGVLQDRAGNDRYLDIRNGQGFSLIGNLGLLLDEAGNDRYQRYMPAPLVPGTPNEQDGAGGAIDDTNLCDNLPRLLQGAGDLGGAGVLLDLDGTDRYDGACIADFGAPADIGRPACSQGNGITGGLGLLADRGADADTYVGVPDRGNNRVIARATPGTDDPANASLTVDTFVDG